MNSRKIDYRKKHIIIIVQIKVKISRKNINYRGTDRMRKTTRVSRRNERHLKIVHAIRPAD